MKYYFLTLAVFLALVAIGCDKKKGGEPATTPTTPVTTVSISDCSVGQIYNSTYGCLDQGGCDNGKGRVPEDASSGAGTCVSGTTVTASDVFGSSKVRWGASLNITSKSTFRQLMKEYGGFCDPPGWYYYVGPNPNDCEYWHDAGFIVIQAGAGNSTNFVTVNVGAGSGEPNGSAITGYNRIYYGYGSFLDYYGMSFNTEYYDVNASTGFELRSHGLFGTQSWNAVYGDSFKVRVESGRLDDSSYYVELWYKNSRFATATMELWPY